MSSQHFTLLLPVIHQFKMVHFRLKSMQQSFLRLVTANTLFMASQATASCGVKGHWDMTLEKKNRWN